MCRASRFELAPQECHQALDTDGLIETSSSGVLADGVMRLSQYLELPRFAVARREQVLDDLVQHLAPLSHAEGLSNSLSDLEQGVGELDELAQ